MDSEYFITSLREFYLDLKSATDTDVDELNIIIDHLKSVPKDFIVGTKILYEIGRKSLQVYDCGVIMGVVAKLIPPGNSHLISKFCNLFYSIFHCEEVFMSRKSQEYLLEKILSLIDSCPTLVHSDGLKAISALLEISLTCDKKCLEMLIGKNGFLTNYLLKSDDDLTQHYAFQCLYHLLSCFVAENALEGQKLELCFKSCFSVLKCNLRNIRGNIIVLKTCLTSLKCLDIMFSSKNVKIDNLGELLGTLKNLLFLGLPGQIITQDTNLFPTLRYPETSHTQESQSESDTPFPKLRKQKKNKRRTKRNHQIKQALDLPSSVTEDRCTTTDASKDIRNLSVHCNKFAPERRWPYNGSDSESSDSESRESLVEIIEIEIRTHAYTVLQKVVQVTDKKVMFGYWSYFLPEHTFIHGLVSSPTIFTTLEKDPDCKVRFGALALVAEMLRSSKQFLMHADGRNAKHLSFTSLSSVLAMMISEIHNHLLPPLLSEDCVKCVVQNLKCIAILVENVPYFKLDTKLILEVLNKLQFLKDTGETPVFVAAIAVYCSVLNTDQIPADIQELMLLPDFYQVCSGKLDYKCADYKITQTPWVIELCQICILREEPLPVKIQSLQLLSSAVRRFFQKSHSFFKDIEEMVLFCLKNPDTSIQLHGAKLLDILGRSMNIVTDVELKKTMQPLVSALWQKVLKEPFIKCLTNDDVITLQSVCCDCLSTVSSEDFGALQTKQQIMYITVLLGLASDLNPNVRGAAIRCLGLFCLFPSLNQDVTFLDDVLVILIKAVEDSNVNVRFKASWSLGNLSDALFVTKDLLDKEISCKFFHSIGMACVQFSKDCDRVKANAVRALGNLLNYIPENFIRVKMMQQFIKESCEELKSALSSSFMKVCWNACYALRNMLKNTHLIQNCDLNLNEVQTCLLQVLKSPNFKVRISAAQALTALTNRSLYGDLFPVIWQDLVSALFTTSSDVNFNEIKHQENLLDQLCLSLCQLAALITPQDIEKIKDCVLCSQEVLLISMWKYGSRLTKEKSSVVYNTIDYLKSIETSRDDPTLTILLDIINQAQNAFHSLNVS